MVEYNMINLKGNSSGEKYHLISLADIPDTFEIGRQFTVDDILAEFKWSMITSLLHAMEKRDIPRYLRERYGGKPVIAARYLVNICQKNEDTLVEVVEHEKLEIEDPNKQWEDIVKELK